MRNKEIFLIILILNIFFNALNSFAETRTVYQCKNEYSFNIYYNNNSASFGSTRTVDYNTCGSITISSLDSGSIDVLMYYATYWLGIFNSSGTLLHQQNGSMSSLNQSITKKIALDKNCYITVKIKGGMVRAASDPVTVNRYTTMTVTTNTFYRDSTPPIVKSITVTGNDQYSNKNIYYYRPDDLKISYTPEDGASVVYGYWPYETRFNYASGISKYRILVNNNLLSEYNTAITAQPLLKGYGSGQYTISGTVYDRAGNPAPLHPITVYLDAEGPNAPTGKIGNDSNNISDEFVQISEDVWSAERPYQASLNNKLYFSITAQGDYSGTIVSGTNTESLIFTVDGQASSTPADGTYIESNGEQFGIYFNELGGVHKISAKYSDNVGNVGDDATFNFYVDNTAPEAPLFVTSKCCIPGANDKSIIYVPIDNQGYLGWESAEDGNEEWQSGTDEYSYFMNVEYENGTTALTADNSSGALFDETGIYKATIDNNLLEGNYRIELDVEDEAGNVAQSNYQMHVGYPPEEVEDVVLIKKDDGYYLEWNYDGKGGQDGYSFDVNIMETDDLLNSDCFWNYDDESEPLEWSEGNIYSIKLPNNLRTKVPYTAKVYVMSEDGFPMYTDLVFNLPNIPAVLVSDIFNVPGPGEIFAPDDFPYFSFNSAQTDSEGDQLGLMLYYKKRGETSFKVVTAGQSEGAPVIAIFEDSSDTDGILDTGIYDWHIEVVEYYNDWDGTLLPWSERVSWPEIDENFAVDGNEPTGLLTAEDSPEEGKINLRAFAFNDGSGATSSGVKEILIWNDVDGDGEFDSEVDTISNAVDDKAIRINVEELPEISIESWVFEIYKSVVSAKMIIIDRVGNTSEPIGVTEAGNNSAPQVSLNMTETNARVGELWTCPPEANLYSASDPEGDDLSYHWDFGDGTESDEAYPDKTYTDDGDYTVTLSVSDWWKQTTSVSFIFHTTNTTEGELMINETWNGEHTLTGDVIIPMGLTLTISEGTTVITPENTGITVSESASINIAGTSESPVSIGPSLSDEPVPLWKGLIVKDVGNITYTSFANAERAIVAGPGATVSIGNCNFSNNRIGLHIVGTEVSLTGVNKFNGNLWYGIKEDSVTVHPDLNGCVFQENENDYYHQDLLILNDSDLIEYIEN